MDFCETCNKSMKKGNMRFHLKSKSHLQNINKNDVQEMDDSENVEDISEFKNDDIVDMNDNNENEYLSDFNNTFKIESMENTFKKDKKQMNNTVFNDIVNKRKMKKIDEDNFSVKSDEIFSNKNKTPLLGKQKRELLARIKQYKLLFKEELKSFRVKKNPNEEELQKYLEEIDSILATSKLDSFITDGVFYVMQVIESISSRYRDYDLTGLSEALKNNKEFLDLMRLLSVKYHVFSNVPPEFQISIIVISTSYLVIVNNRRNRQQLEESLKNTKI